MSESETERERERERQRERERERERERKTQKEREREGGREGGRERERERERKRVMMTEGPKNMYVHMQRDKASFRAPGGLISVNICKAASHPCEVQGIPKGSSKVYGRDSDRDPKQGTS